jgi:hypothetical protein
MQTLRDIIIDIIFLVVYLVAQYPGITGLLLHEWISMGLILVALIHTIVHWEWVQDTLSRFSGRIPALLRWNLVINIALFIVFLIVAVSGLMVSCHVLFFFGLYAPGYFIWKPMHAIFAEVLFALILAHLVMHWRWIFSAVKDKTSNDD